MLSCIDFLVTPFAYFLDWAVLTDGIVNKGGYCRHRATFLSSHLCMHVSPPLALLVKKAERIGRIANRLIRPRTLVFLSSKQNCRSPICDILAVID